MKSMKALADPTRGQIVEMVARGEMSSGEISSHFSISAAAISQHLRDLREADLVCTRVHGQRHVYALNGQGLDEVAPWLARVRAFWSIHLDALENERQGARAGKSRGLEQRNEQLREHT